MSAPDAARVLHRRATDYAAMANAAIARGAHSDGQIRGLYRKAASFEEEALKALDDTASPISRAIFSATWCWLLVKAGDAERARFEARKLLADPRIVDNHARATIAKILDPSVKVKLPTGDRRSFIFHRSAIA